MAMTVVVAQEEPEMLELIRISLEDAGYEALSASDGIRAYEAIEHGNPVAVILDLSLPSLSGFRLIKLLRRNPLFRNVPLIVTSAYSFEEVEDITGEGVDAFIPRPFSPVDLLSRLEYALSRMSLNDPALSATSPSIEGTISSSADGLADSQHVRSRLSARF